MKGRSWLAAMALAWTWGAQAASYAVVDAIQAPAWVERGGKRQVLVPGMELRNHDRVLTGPGARAIVQLADGSAVKLGENARMGVNALGRREGGVFTAALDVATGAFRLTTDIFRRFQDRRAINVRAGLVTAGIRGTDIWGRSDAGRNFICLLEGRIVASHPLGEAAELSEPRQCYGADVGKGPEPVAVVEAARLQAWARETELREDSAAVQRGGRWAVSLATENSQARALNLYDRALAIGYVPRIVPRRAEAGTYRYELRVERVRSEAEAQLLAARLARELELGAPRVVKP